MVFVLLGLVRVGTGDIKMWSSSILFLVAGVLFCGLVSSGIMCGSINICDVAICTHVSLYALGLCISFTLISAGPCSLFVTS